MAEHPKTEAGLRSALAEHLDPKVVEALPVGFNLSDLLVLVRRIKDIAPQVISLVSEIISLFVKDKTT